jgi:hypothetical protein
LNKERLTKEKHTDLFKRRDIGETFKKWRSEEMVKPECFYPRFDEKNLGKTW